MMVNAIVNNKTPSRDIFLNGHVDEVTVGMVMEHIFEINALDDMNEGILKDYERDPIVLRINTYGGYIYDKWALIDTIMTSETPVITMAMGKVMSAGIFILLAGDKRIGNKHTSYMIHNLSGGAGGQPDDIKDSYEHMKVLEQMGKDFILSRTSISKEKLDDLYKTKTDWYFSSKEALKYGIIDEVI
jgi:ATP-dependent Clp protease protease subunit